MRGSERVALGAALAYPTLLTWIYFVALAKQPAHVQQTAYSLGKFAQFAFPLIWARGVCREPWPQLRPTRRGLGLGLAFGVAVAAAMFGLYYGLIAPRNLLGNAEGVVRAKVAGLGVDTLPRYVLLGAFYSLGHSGLEEYYWRWFVFRRSRSQWGIGTAVVVSSLGFMAHHVILLGTFFGYGHWATWLFAGAIAVGGAFWAWLDHRSKQLYGPWLSHLLVDAAIFSIGYSLAAGAFR